MTNENNLTVQDRLWIGPLAERVIVTPMLKSTVEENSIDLRLGTKFIFTRRAQFEQADPLEMDERSIHSFLEVHWASIGEPVALHPQMFMLAATLEYVSLPANVGGFITTRSSYGRLGTLSVTAQVVHPGFKGCLTLELANLGDAVVKLTPGLRIAQLTLGTVEPAEDSSSGKYQLATDPEFPKLWEDSDRAWLVEERKRWSTGLN